MCSASPLPLPHVSHEEASPIPTPRFGAEGPCKRPQPLCGFGEGKKELRIRVRSPSGAQGLLCFPCSLSGFGSPGGDTIRGDFSLKHSAFGTGGNGAGARLLLGAIPGAGAGEASCAQSARNEDRRGQRWRRGEARNPKHALRLPFPVSQPFPCAHRSPTQTDFPPAWSRLAVGCFGAEGQAPTQLHLPSGSKIKQFPRPRAPGLGQPPAPGLWHRRRWLSPKSRRRGRLCAPPPRLVPTRLSCCFLPN